MPKAFTGICASVFLPSLYIRVGPGNNWLKALKPTVNNPPNNPNPFRLIVLVSSFGLVNCNPIWRLINKGPLGLSLKNLLILNESSLDALLAKDHPPLINPSSDELVDSLLGIGAVIYG